MASVPVIREMAPDSQCHWRYRELAPDSQVHHRVCCDQELVISRYQELAPDNQVHLRIGACYQELAPDNLQEARHLGQVL